MSEGQSQSPSTAAPGWYPDPVTGQSRYWDGRAWSDLSLAPSPSSVPSSSRNNVLGIVALAAAVLGFLFACIPGFFVIGWLLLPVAFVLSLVSLFLKGRSKWAGLTALIVSIVGTIVGFVVFFASLSTALSEGVTSVDVSVTQPGAGKGGENQATVEEGTRTNPLPFGATIQNDDWTFTLTGINLDGNADVAAGNMFNDKPAEGQTYIIVEASATYKGSGEGTSSVVHIDYVTADGTVLSTWDSTVAGVDPKFGQATLYAGATDAGKAVFLVPSSLDGLIRVKPGLFAKEVFFKLQ